MLVEFNTEEVNCLTGWFKFHCCSHFILTTFLGLVIGWERRAIWIYASKMVGSTTDGNAESYTTYLCTKNSGHLEGKNMSPGWNCPKSAALSGRGDIRTQACWPPGSNVGHLLRFSIWGGSEATGQAQCPL